APARLPAMARAGSGVPAGVRTINPRSGGPRSETFRILSPLPISEREGWLESRRRAALQRLTSLQNRLDVGKRVVADPDAVVVVRPNKQVARQFVGRRTANGHKSVIAPTIIRENLTSRAEERARRADVGAASNPDVNIVRLYRLGDLCPELVHILERH